MKFKMFGATRSTKDGGDTLITEIRLSMKRSQVRGAMDSRESRKLFAKQLMQEGRVNYPGCGCSHCAKGWDCCGKMVPGWPRFFKKPYGLLVQQVYSRNI
jgi:hypothetical protein